MYIYIYTYIYIYVYVYIYIYIYMAFAGGALEQGQTHQRRHHLYSRSLAGGVLVHVPQLLECVLRLLQKLKKKNR